MNRYRHAVLGASLALVSVSYEAGGGLVTQDPSPGTVRAPVVWKQLGTDVLENLLFADGSIWISDSTAGTVRRFGPTGAEEAGLTGIASPGGLAEGPDGLIYAGHGSGILNALTRNGAAKVVRFDPADPNGTVEDYAAGFNMANGMTFGPGGDLFVSNDFDYGLIRIPAADPSSWSEFAHVWGTNGLAIVGGDLYANVTFDQRSPIERIPLDAPDDHETAVQLTFGVASLEPALYTDPDATAPLLGIKGLDDITRDGEGNLYPVANGLGELLKVDPLTGDACLLAGGLRNPSSVRIAPAGSGFDTSGEALTFYVVEFSGAIRIVGYTP
ncbi:MAG: hypothetical protein ACREQQ_17750 [Candidatus Binatia bacterium]